MDCIDSPAKLQAICERDCNGKAGAGFEIMSGITRQPKVLRCCAGLESEKPDPGPTHGLGSGLAQIFNTEIAAIPTSTHKASGIEKLPDFICKLIRIIGMS